LTFYTNVIRHWDELKVRGFDDRGRRFEQEVKFKPSIYLSSNTSGKPMKDIRGRTVYEKKFKSMREAHDYRKQYADVEGVEIHGMEDPIIQFIAEAFPGTIKYDLTLPRVLSIDIECASEDGFPSIEKANEAVLLISLVDRSSLAVRVFTCKPFKATDHSPFKIEVAQFEDEYHLLRGFINFWSSNYPDIVTGWNSNFFDMIYLKRRIDRIIGSDVASKLSPYGKIDEKQVTMGNKTQHRLELGGVALIDYLDLYKKYTYITQESYKLDHIASVELNENKLDHSEYESFKEFYDKGWDKFCNYNIHDAILVHKLEAKMKLLETLMTMAYTGKCNYEDVFRQTKLWDSLIHSHLLEKGVVVPPKKRSMGATYEGAYVKSPQLGMHKDVASFDLQSLYPHLMMGYNISPDTIVDGKRANVSVDSLLTQVDPDDGYRYEKNLSLTANGVYYRKDTRGFLADLMDQLYNMRSTAKKEMLKITQDYEKTGNQDLVKDISRLNNLQLAAKIVLNNAYGAIGNAGFRYYDIRIAEGITLSGQLSIRWIERELNDFLNKALNTKDVDYVIAIDTDSCYLRLESVMNKICNDKESRIDTMDRFCKEVLQPVIDKGYDKLAKFMNAYEQKMIMKREALADKGIWTAKKRYVLRVYDNEGVRYKEPKIKATGLEIVRSSTPQLVRNLLKKGVEVIMESDKDTLMAFIDECREKFEVSPIEAISFSRGLNGTSQYTGKNTIYTKGTPIQVRGALLHNYHLEKMGLSHKYQPLQDGDKIKFVYLRKPNPIHEDVISFSGTLPKEFNLDQYVDYDMMFEKTFLSALQSITTPIGWNLTQTSSLEDFFV